MMKQYLIVKSDDLTIIGAILRPDPDAGPIIPQGDSPIAGTELVLYDGEFTREGRSDTEVATWANGAVAWTETATLEDLKAKKNAEINQWRATANSTSFQYGGKAIACDALSRSDIDAVANHIGLFGSLPVKFPGAWKAIDNTYVPIPDVAAFKDLYMAMTSQGTDNFDRSQSLKADLAKATTPEQVSAINP